MRKNGFTLIELLAVILILGVIALIAIPGVSKVIDKAGSGAAETSTRHYIDSINNKIAVSLLDSDSSNDIKDGVLSISELDLDISGSKSVNGTVIVENGKVKEINTKINM